MTTTVTRAEHLAWCKARARVYLPHEPMQAFASMASDLGKHEETRDHKGMEIGMTMLLAGLLKSPEQMRDFINGFN